MRLPPRPRRSRVLSGYAVLRPADGRADGPYLVMSTSTQRQTEGHEHPDRGSLNLWHDGVPLIADPGDGWSGYQWDAFPPNASFGPRGSESHSLVSFANSTWHPRGAYHNEWGLRGPAWLVRSAFTESVAYVDLDVTRAVQLSQLAGVRGNGRRSEPRIETGTDTGSGACISAGCDSRVHRCWLRLRSLRLHPHGQHTHLARPPLLIWPPL